MTTSNGFDIHIQSQEANSLGSVTEGPRNQEERGTLNGYSVVYSDNTPNETPPPTANQHLVSKELELSFQENPINIAGKALAEPLVEQSVQQKYAASQKNDNQSSQANFITEQGLVESMESGVSEEMEELEGDFDLDDIEEGGDEGDDEAAVEEGHRAEKQAHRFINRLNKHQAASKYKGLMNHLKNLLKHKDKEDVLKHLKEEFPNIAEKILNKKDLKVVDVILAVIGAEFSEITEQHNLLECFRSCIEENLSRKGGKDAKLELLLSRVTDAIQELTGDATRMARIQAGYDLIPRIAEKLPSPQELQASGLQSVETLSSLILDKFLTFKGEKQAIFQALCAGLMLNTALVEEFIGNKELKRLANFKKNVELLKEILGRELKVVTNFMGGMNVVVSIRETLQIASQIDSLYHLIEKSLTDTKNVA